jgi:hypothetical protein
MNSEYNPFPPVVDLLVVRKDRTAEDSGLALGSDLRRRKSVLSPQESVGLQDVEQERYPG